MEERAKPAYRIVYAIFDSEGNWHTSKEGALLAYDNKENAINGMRLHGGARVTQYRILFDGDVEINDIES